jgi:hypothetical protein
MIINLELVAIAKTTGLSAIVSSISAEEHFLQKA